MVQGNFQATALYMFFANQNDYSNESELVQNMYMHNLLLENRCCLYSSAFSTQRKYRCYLKRANCCPIPLFVLSFIHSILYTAVWRARWSQWKQKENRYKKRRRKNIVTKSTLQRNVWTFGYFHHRSIWTVNYLLCYRQITNVAVHFGAKRPKGIKQT